MEEDIINFIMNDTEGQEYLSLTDTQKENIIDIIMEFNRTLRSSYYGWDKAIEGGDYTVESTYNPNTKEITNVRRL